MIEKHIIIRLERIQNIQSSNVDLDTQNGVFYDFNTFVLLSFGQI